MKKKVDAFLSFLVLICGLYFRFGVNYKEVGKRMSLHFLQLNMMTILNGIIISVNFFINKMIYLKEFGLYVFFISVLIPLLATIYLSLSYYDTIIYKEIKVKLVYYIIAPIYFLGSLTLYFISLWLVFKP